MVTRFWCDAATKKVWAVGSKAWRSHLKVCVTRLRVRVEEELGKASENQRER